MVETFMYLSANGNRKREGGRTITQNVGSFIDSLPDMLVPRKICRYWELLILLFLEFANDT